MWEGREGTFEQGRGPRGGADEGRGSGYTRAGRVYPSPSSREQQGGWGDIDSRGCPSRRAVPELTLLDLHAGSFLETSRGASVPWGVPGSTTAAPPTRPPLPARH